MEGRHMLSKKIPLNHGFTEICLEKTNVLDYRNFDN